MYNDQTSSVISEELAGKSPMVSSLLRTEVVSALNKGRQFMNLRLKVVVNEVGQAFIGMAVR